MTATIDNLFGAGAGVSTSGKPGAQDANGADRFLKLLVTQLQNQDPLNPMDNAQITSQMAQINTVTGIEKLNTGLQGLTAQFMQMQALQGATLVGRDVTVTGNRLAAVEGQGQGGFSLAGPADSVNVEILNPAGVVVDTMTLGALGEGRHGFAWPGKAGVDPATHTFRIAARQGAAKVGAVPLMLDRVKSVSVDGSAGLMLELARSGAVPYGDVHALN